jgi:hypothetical protein
MPRFTIESSIAQPGVYWSPAEVEMSVKSRGAPRSVIGPAVPRFHEVFAEFLPK